MGWSLTGKHSTAQLEQLRVKCLAHELRQLLVSFMRWRKCCLIYFPCTDCPSWWRDSVMNARLMWHPPSSNSGSCCSGRGDEQANGINKWTDTHYQHTDSQSFDSKRRSLMQGGRFGSYESKVNLLITQPHQSSFPESFTWKFLVSTGFTLPDGKHAWVFIWLTLYFSQLWLASLYNTEPLWALMKCDSLYSTAFFLFEFKSSSQVAAWSIYQRGLRHCPL